MDNVKETAKLIKQHIKRQKAAYIAGSVAVGLVALHRSNTKMFYEFLEEKGIDPMEYYSPEVYKELNS